MVRSRLGERCYRVSVFLRCVHNSSGTIGGYPDNRLRESASVRKDDLSFKWTAKAMQICRNQYPMGHFRFVGGFPSRRFHCLECAMDAPSTLQEAILYFSDFDRAFECARNLRWPGGIVSCVRCGFERPAFLRRRYIWHCLNCDRQFSVKTNTPFEGSSIGINKWMLAVWLLCNSNDGIAPIDIGEALGVTPHSARYLLDRLAKAMSNDSGAKHPLKSASGLTTVPPRRLRGKRLVYLDRDQAG